MTFPSRVGAVESWIADPGAPAPGTWVLTEITSRSAPCNIWDPLRLPDALTAMPSPALSGLRRRGNERPNIQARANTMSPKADHPDHGLAPRMNVDSPARWFISGGP